jgi:hypothetical protein
MRPVGFVVFGCLTVPKYRQQIEDAYATWVQDALAAGCIVRFFTGEIPSTLEKGLADLCVNVQFGDTYYSATFKQWRGFEHIQTECEPCRWYCTFGTDTFVHIPNVLRMLELYKEDTRSLCIGGGVATELVNGEVVSYFSGGAGIFLNTSAIEAICDAVPEFIHWWIQTEMRHTTTTTEDGLICEKTVFGASDLQMGYLCKQCGIEEVSLGSEVLDGGSKYVDVIQKLDRILTCHNMHHDDFYDCHRRIHISTCDDVSACGDSS